MRCESMPPARTAIADPAQDAVKFRLSDAEIWVIRSRGNGLLVTSAGSVWNRGLTLRFLGTGQDYRAALAPNRTLQWRHSRNRGRKVRVRVHARLWCSGRICTAPYIAERVI